MDFFDELRKIYDGNGEMFRNDLIDIINKVRKESMFIKENGNRIYTGCGTKIDIVNGSIDLISPFEKNIKLI